jgi:hypothetical protein
MRFSGMMAIGALAAACASHSAFAQSEGPGAGTWGAEGTAFGAANLLKFRSASSAWLFGLSGAAAIRNSDNTSFDGSNGYLSVRVGRRSYRSTNEKVRPFSTISAMANLQGGSGFARTWSLGPALEMGAAYFFSSHVSLGAAGELAALYENRSGGLTSNGFAVNFSGFRLLGAVYF